MPTNRFLVVAKYAVGSNRGLKDVELVDTRIQGGGIKENLVETFKGSYPQVVPRYRSLRRYALPGRLGSASRPTC
jgi:hypothetical protein